MLFRLKVGLTLLKNHTVKSTVPYSKSWQSFAWTKYTQQQRFLSCVQLKSAVSRRSHRCTVGAADGSRAAAVLQPMEATGKHWTRTSRYVCQEKKLTRKVPESPVSHPSLTLFTAAIITGSSPIAFIYHHPSSHPLPSLCPRSHFPAPALR